MTSGQTSFPVAPSIFKFAQHGKSRRLGQRAAAAHGEDRRRPLPSSRSLNTEAINHDPAITFIQTGIADPGRPSIGAWLTYGLGSENENLPAFVVMISPEAGNGDQPLYDRLWGSGFLPSRYQGVKFRSSGDPVLYLSNPAGHRSQDAARYAGRRWRS